ncbi:MAG: SDR family NAD(P)-dependent oxidoreductase [Hyphomicrobiaceae bacterium]
MKLKDKVAIVTGAGRNIGEDTAKLFAKEGAKIAVVDLDKARCTKVAGDIREARGMAAAFVADIADEASVERLVADIVSKLGRIDILINNVAISDNKQIFEISLEEWNRVMAVTLTSPFLMGRAAARQMIAQKSGGVIVNVGSTSGFYGRSSAIAYTTAKGGVTNLTRSMAIQLAPHNIRCVLAVPNKIGSPVGKEDFDPTRPVVNLRQNRAGTPMDMAKVLLFLASDDADFITGTSVFVDGGCSAVMPGDKNAGG